MPCAYEVFEASLDAVKQLEGRHTVLAAKTGYTQ